MAKAAKKGKQVTNLPDKTKPIPVQSGTDRTLYITWGAPKNTSHIDYYAVQWSYAVGNTYDVKGKNKKATSTTLGNTSYWSASMIAKNHNNLQWFDEDEKKVTHSSTVQKISIYTVPDIAISARVKVKPVSKLKKNKKDHYWSGAWSDTYYRDYENKPVITVPPTPNVTVNGNVITARIENYRDSNAKYIYFQMIEDDTKQVETGMPSIDTATSTSVTFVSTKATAGHKYKVRAQAFSVDKKYYSEWSDYSSNVLTTPSLDSKTSFTVQALTSTSVRASWKVSTTGNLNGYYIKYATEAWMFNNDDVGKVESNTGSAQITGLEAGKKWIFRLYGKNTDGEESKNYIERTAVLGTKPGVPTAWSETSTAEAGETTTVYWVHNSEDGSKETKALVYFELFKPGVTTFDTEHAYKKNSFEVIKPTTTPSPYSSGDSEQNSISSFTFRPGAADGSDTSWFFSDLTDGCTIQWYVFTWGAIDTPSEHSTAKQIKVYAKPALSVTLPLDNTTYPFNFEFNSWPDTTNVVSYDVKITSGDRYVTEDASGRTRIVGEGEAVYSKIIIPEDPTNHTYNFVLTAGDAILENQIPYVVTVTVSLSNGLSETTSVAFSPEFVDDEEFVIGCEIDYDDEDRTATISPYAVVDDDMDKQYYEYIPNVELAVYRLEYDGNLKLIQDGIENDGTMFIVDPHPALDVPRYRIVATNTSNGTSAFEDFEGEETEETSIIIQWDEEWGNYKLTPEEEELEGELAEPVSTGHMLVLPYNIKVSDSNSPDVSFANYIGRKHPVSYYGTHMGTKTSWSSDIPKTDTETLFMIRQLAAFMGDCYVREPSGIGYWAQVNVNYSRDYDSMIIPVSLDITRVDGGA